MGLIKKNAPVLFAIIMIYIFALIGTAPAAETKTVLILPFAIHADKDLASIMPEDIVRFNRDYILPNGFSQSYQNQIISAPMTVSSAVTGATRFAGS